MFQRQRAASIGRGSTAWVNTSRTVARLTIFITESSAKEWCGPSAMVTESSSAAAWSSKSKVTQKRFRSASPSARLRRAP